MRRESRAAPSKTKQTDPRATDEENMWKAALAASVAALAWADHPRIHDIQGAAHISPWVGEEVVDVEGVVTGLAPHGFYMQDDVPDGDVATSEGIRVSSEMSVATGDVVQVTGVVREMRPGCEGCSPSDDAFDNLTTTELEASAVVVVGRSELPDPTPLGSGAGDRRPPAKIVEDSAIRDVESVGPFDPTRSGIDFYESMEGMRVRIENARAVGPTVRPVGRSTELAIVPSGGMGFGPFTSSGGLLEVPEDNNPERIIVTGGARLPDLDVGDSFTAPLVGIVDYAFGHFTLIADQAPFGLRLSPPRVRPALLPTGPEDFTVATFNVQNLGPRSARAKLDGIAEVIANDLAGPDVVVLQEIQDSSGPTDDGTTDAAQTYRVLVDAIDSRGGPSYTFRDVPPDDAADGGELGANIRVGFLLREDRGLKMIDRVGTDPIGSNLVRSYAGRVQLDRSPGRVDPGNPAFAHSRKPVAIEVDFRGSVIFVVGVHFTSQLADPPLFGRFQPAGRPTRFQRTDQARVVGDFVRHVLEIDPGARVVVAGDMNDSPSSPPFAVLGSADLRDVAAALPSGERYTYIFEGNSEAIDHLLATRSLADNVRALAIAHVNADFVHAFSDHDPVVARFAVRAEPTNYEVGACGCSQVNRGRGSRWWAVFLFLLFARRGRTSIRQIRRSPGPPSQFLWGPSFSGKYLAHGPSTRAGFLSSLVGFMPRRTASARRIESQRLVGDERRIMR
jgi:predicted extracellular nuclease